MPAPRESPRAPAPRPRRTERLLRFAGGVLIGSIALFCSLLLVVRFFVLPQFETQRGDIAEYLSKQLGAPVEIDGLTTGWDGWNPKLVVTGVRVRDRAGAAKLPLLELPQVEGIVSWESLPRLELQLKELTIERPRLAIRRDRAGRIHLAGLEIDPEATGDDRPFTDWLLKQRHIVVRDALISWNDDRRNAPQLVLDRVQIRLDHTQGEHRFGVTGVPPAELASPLDLRGQLTGASFRDWEKANGRVYLRLDYADVAAWKEWIPLPIPVESGKGALRLWFEFASGIAKEVTGDVELANVRVRVQPDLPQLELTHLSGRLGWKQEGGRRSFTTRGLSFVSRDGLSLTPTDFALTMTEGSDGTMTGGEIAFDRLELAPLVGLAAHLPLSERWRQDLATYLPRGTVAAGRYAWAGPTDAPTTFTARGDFVDAGVTAQRTFPGATGVSGSFEASERGGKLNVSGKAVTVALPRVFAEPLAFDRFDGAVRWERSADGYSVRVDEFAFANADLAGGVSGSWHERDAGPGEIDVKAHVTRGDITRLGPYLPITMEKATRNWLRLALQKGTVAEGKLTLIGNLAEFPFGKGKRGTFVAAMKTKGVTLDYADHWPPLTELDAEVRFDATRLTIDGARAKIQGADVGRTKAEIADLSAEHPLLTVNGEASGATTVFLQFIESSPVAGWIGHFTDAAKATGNGHLALRFDVPLGKGESTTVAGEYTFVDNDLRLPGLVPLAKVSGKLAFSEHDMRATDLVAEVLGGPAKLSVMSSEGRVRVNASGTANLALVRTAFPVLFADRLGGTSDWLLAASVRPEGSTWSIDAPMVGATIDLPAPVGKAAADAMPLHIERREVPNRTNQDTLIVEMRGVARLALQRRITAGDVAVDRALLLVGKATERPGDTERPGLWIRADVGVLNIDDWLAVRAREEAKSGAREETKGATSGGGGLALNGVDLDASLLQAIGRRFRDIKVVARHAPDAWRLTLAGPEIDGTAAWYSPGGEHPNGRIVARLARLTMPGPGDLVPWQGAIETAPRADAAANSWPGIDLTAESFLSKGRDLGKLEVVAQPTASDWRIDRLALSSQAGRIVASGAWRASVRPQQTRLDVKLEAQEAGAFLARMGYPEAIKGTPTKIDGQLAWAGAPSEFDYPTLSGAFSVSAGAGQFTKIDPGIGKLLGVLSLQALPRRITLDFRDVFSEGFAFDEISGNVRIQNGVMQSNDLKISGPAARVQIAGDADLAKETQQLNVRVQPSLATSFSAGTAGAAMLLLAANPVLAAAVGAGTLLAQKIMQDPIENLFSYEYRVTGSWTDPVVARVARSTASAAPAASAESQVK